MLPSAFTFHAFLCPCTEDRLDCWITSMGSLVIWLLFRAVSDRDQQRPEGRRRMDLGSYSLGSSQPPPGCHCAALQSEAQCTQLPRWVLIMLSSLSPFRPGMVMPRVVTVPSLIPLNPVHALSSPYIDFSSNCPSSMRHLFPTRALIVRFSPPECPSGTSLPHALLLVLQAGK